MPRLSKKYKQEWQFFLDDRNRMKYNELCKKCERECKQSFRAIIVDCPVERKNRRKNQKNGKRNLWIQKMMKISRASIAMPTIVTLVLARVSTPENRPFGGVQSVCSVVM